jgi:flagellin-like protein
VRDDPPDENGAVQRPSRCSVGNAGGRSGQVAVGTLVIFIALTLVAVVTAAVLFDTTGLLESRASDTGDETSDQLSDRLDVVATTGANITDREVNQVEVVVADSPGGSSLDLRNVTVQWLGPEVGTTLVHEGNAAAGQDTFSTVSYTDPDGTFPVLTSTEDRYALRFEPGVVFGDAGLAEGDRVDLTLVTPAGTTLPLRISIPQSLAGKDSVEL